MSSLEIISITLSLISGLRLEQRAGVWQLESTQPIDIQLFNKQDQAYKGYGSLLSYFAQCLYWNILFLSAIIQQMLKELTYFQYLEDDMRRLQEQSSELNALLTQAYSPPNKMYCSLKQQIDNILNEENQLQEVVSVILQQVTTGTLLPSQIDSHQLQHMFVNSLVLPEWFPHVLDKEYSRYRVQLDSYAKNLAGVHSLQEKRKAMREERQNLEVLYRRTLAISALQKQQNFSDIDIMQDVQHLRNRVKHVRKTFQYFCNQVGGKLREFVQSLVDKTIHFSKGQAMVKDHRKNASDIFKYRQNSYEELQFKPSNQFRRSNDKLQYFSPSKIDITSKIKPVHQRQRLEDYYGHTQKLIKNAPTPPPHPTPVFHPTQANYDARQPSTCRNHGGQMHTHRHTCSKGKDWLRSAKSQERFIAHHHHHHHSPIDSSRKYDYRRVVNRGSEYF